MNISDQRVLGKIRNGRVSSWHSLCTTAVSSVHTDGRGVQLHFITHIFKVLSS